jgi:heme exporter protein B
MKNFLTLLAHEIRLQMRHKTEWASLSLFFIIVIILTPFALGPDPDILRRLAPGLIWFAALLMSLLSLDRLFVQDARDGILDEMLISPLPFEMIIFAKLLAQILIMLVALALMVFPAALLLGMNINLVPVLFLTFVLGIPVLVFLGGIMAALTVALNRNAALLTLLLMPFYIPVLIFANGACDSAHSTQSLLFLASLLTLIIPIAPFIMAALLRYGAE